MSTVWRNLKFFESRPVTGDLERDEFASCCVSEEYIITGDREGGIHVYSLHGEPLVFFPGFEGPVVWVGCKHNTIVTVGEDTPTVLVMRIWDLNSIRSHQTGVLSTRPSHREFFFFSNSFPPPPEKKNISTLLAPPLESYLTCFDFDSPLDRFAAIVSSSEVYYITSSVETPKLMKQKRLVSASGKGEAVFLAFAPSSVKVKSHTNILFTVSVESVTAWTFGAKTTAHLCPVEFQYNPSCAAVSESGALVLAGMHSTQVAVAGPLSPSSTGYDPTLPNSWRIIDLESPPKVQLACFKQYLLITSRHETREDHFFLQCYDVSNSIRALGRAQEQVANCARVVPGPGGILVASLASLTVPNSGYKLTYMTEVSLNKKLEVLMSREFYDIAKNVVEEVPGVDVALKMNITKKYGDFLESKMHYDAAMDEYIQTIGYLEPSYVIRKFLGSSTLPQLTRYLEALHRKRDTKSFSTVHHTTLLLNLYIKQHDEEKLNEFIRRTDVRFDPHNVIAVCRQGGFYDAALFVADCYAQSHDYVRIKVRDLHQPVEALEFLETLGVDDAEYILRSMGNELVSIEPKKTTLLITQLCTRWPGPTRRLASLGESSTLDAHRSEASFFLHVFIDSPLCLLYFLRAVIASGVMDFKESEKLDVHRSTFNTLFELYITKHLPKCVDNAHPDRGEDFEEEPYEERLHQAIVFLQAYQGNYDDYVALSVAYQHHFEEGYLYLLKRLHLTDQTVSFLLQKYESEPGEDTIAKILKVCSDSTAPAAQLQETWIHLLRSIASRPTPNLHNIETVLHYIQEKDLLSPVVVLEVLTHCSSKGLPLLVVKEFCMRHLTKKKSLLDQIQAEIDTKKEKRDTLQKEIEKLKGSAVVLSSSQCAHCKQSLDFPVVHFMCQHSFHQRCLHVPNECNVCISTQRRVLESIQEGKEAKKEPMFSDKPVNSDLFNTCSYFMGVELDPPIGTHSDVVSAEDLEVW